MTTTYVDDSGGIVRKIAKIFVADAGGVVRQVKRMFVADSGGITRLVYVLATYALPSGTSAQNDDIGVSFAQTTLTLSLNGAYAVYGANLGTFESGNWVTPTSVAPGAYTIRAHRVSGGTPNGDALDTDLALTTSRSWTVSTVGGTSLTNLTLTLKDGGGNVVATSNVGIRADV